MKLKKLLAGILSTAMVLGTMAVPVFADTLTTTTLPQADSNGIINIEENANIDLNGETINNKIVISGEVDCVKISNGTINGGTVTKVINGLSQKMYDYVLAIDTTADVTLENVTIVGDDVTDKAGIGGISIVNGGNIEIINSVIQSANVTVTRSGASGLTEPSNAINIFGGKVDSVTINSCTLTGGNLICNENFTSYQDDGANLCYKNLDEALFLGVNTTLNVVSSTITGGNSAYGNGASALKIGLQGVGSDITIEKTTLNGGNGGVSNNVTNHGHSGPALEITNNGDNATKLAIKDNSVLKAGKNSLFFGEVQENAVTMTSTPESFSVSDSKIIANGGIGIKNTSRGNTWNITLDNVEFATEGGEAIQSYNRDCVAEVSGELKITGKLGTNVQLEGDYTLTSAAKIDDVYYATLDEALEAAKTGETITLVNDTSVGNVNDFRNDIDLNGKTLTFTGSEYFLNNDGIDVKISSGTILANNITATRQAFIDCFGDAGDSKVETLIFDDVKFYCTNLTTSSGRDYIINVCNGSKFVAQNGSKFYIDNCAGARVFVNNSPVGGSEIVLDNAEIYVDGAKTVFQQKMTIKNCKTVNIENVETGVRTGNGITIDNSNITVTNSIRGAYVDEGSNLEFINGSTFTANKIILEDDTANVINENDNSTIKAEIVTEKVTGPVANTVKVVYEDVTENEGEKVYDIYVVAEENTINRLTAVQMALNLTTTDDFEMTVTAAEGVARSFENEMYLFNFDGETKPSATGTKIKLGQVKLVGYGKFTLAIDATKENKAHATTLDDNIVTDFIVGGSKLGKGDLDISAKLEDEVKIPTRKLTINITFPNTVEENVVAYQAMNVKIGDDVITLGDEGDVTMEQGAYVIEKELVKDTPYTVEVSGAGYRTARYTVTMNDNKTLNFWNNVKDVPTEVETDKDSSKKDVTFLAGDIVKDNKINIYDLSAVVSYFGTTNVTTAASAYAKYDLDRNGKIDSKDVAYVLASWNK